jgi:hypothetical protein
MNFHSILYISSFYLDNKNIPNFAQYTMETIVPCCFSILFKSNTDFNDAQQTLVIKLSLIINV